MERVNSGFALDSTYSEIQLDNYNRLDHIIEKHSVPLEILTALAKSYHTMHILDFTTDHVVEFNSTLDIRQFQNPQLGVQSQIKQIFNDVIPKEERKRVMTFMDITTLQERLAGKKSLSMEFIGLFSGWVRGTFVPMRYDQNGNIQSVIFCTRIIDEEKQREEKLILKSNTDELTGLFNRHAYEDAMKSLLKNELAENIIIVSMDLNGLKETNDRLGHLVGDKLIRGAADCIKNTIGRFGNVYRTGGDEFVAILMLTYDELVPLKGEFKKTCEKWSKDNNLKLTISAGYITRAHHPDLSMYDLIKLADQRMYIDKAHFYSEKGVDRRAQRTAFTDISKSYEKIIRVNIEDESYEDLKNFTDLEAFDDSLNLTVTSCRNYYIKKGYVHPDDIEVFNNSFDINKIRSHFKKDNSVMRTFYRWRYGDIFKKVMAEVIPASENYSEKNVYFCIKIIE